MNRVLWVSSLCAALLFSAESDGFELKPGRVRDPAGLQLFQRAIYNPVHDSYLLLYADGRALVGHLSPGGVFSGETALSANIGVTHVNAAFNPDDGTFLVAYRDGDPAEIYGRYLTSNGMPIGGSFFIGSGGGPNIAFSLASGRYVVTWEQLSAGVVRYRVVDGDSTSASPNLTGVQTVATGLSDGVAYGSASDKFLVVYIRDVGGSAKANVYGRFISSNGRSLGPEFVIGGGFENQQRPRVSYAPSTDRWMVTWENWAGCGGGCPHVQGALVNASGNVVKSFNVAATSAWDLPGPIGYNPVTDTFVTAWRSAYSDTNIQVRAGEFSPVDGKPVGSTVLVTDKNAAVEAIATRPDPLTPQTLFLWRMGFGSDGLHAGLLGLDAPEPESTPPAKVTDLSGTSAPAGAAVPATAIASTSPGPSSQDMTQTTDGNPSTYWSSPDRSKIVPEFITWDLGTEKTLSQINLLSRSAGNLFPVDYEIQVSRDDVAFDTVFSVTGASVGPGTRVEHVVAEPTARYVRVWITRTARSFTGNFKAQLAEVEVLEASTGAAVALEWTAPGDDGTEGTAAAYDVRWSSKTITEANFDQAMKVDDVPAPSPAGTRERLSVAGFPRETLVYFALKARDEIPNVSPLSNVISVATQGVAPAAVRGFAASNPTGSTVDLSWQPSGDDGDEGNATSYDIRYSTAPINDSNFAAAASVLRPAKNPKPAMESYRLGGLAPQTTYFFAIKALDDVGIPSLISGGAPVMATTLDVVPPAGITDLAVHGRVATPLAAKAVAASGQSSTTTGKEKATDVNPWSYWSSPGRSAPQDEFITVDLGSVRSIERVTLLSRSAGVLFPKALEIQVSTDNESFRTVADGVDLPATQGTLHTFEFPRVDARYMRVLVTETRLSAGGLYYAQIAEIEVSEAITSYVLTLTWTEPGDDGTSGTAAYYDVRYSGSPITTDAQFEAASALAGEPTPAVAGSAATFSFDPPGEGIYLYFRMRAFDDGGNPSPLSNQASALVAIVPPGTIGDLTAFDPTSTSVSLAWTATGDDVNFGTAQSFDLRYAACPLDEGNFELGHLVSGVPAPAIAGTPQRMTVPGLTPSTTYCFAMKAYDEAGASSDLSNVVTVTTDAPDTTPPSAINDLRGSTPFTVHRLVAPAIAASSEAWSMTVFANATDGNVHSYWGSVGTAAPTIQWITLDTGAAHEIGQVRVLSRSAGALFPEELEIQVSNDNVSFTTVTVATELPSTPGLWHTFEFPAAFGRYVRVVATKPRSTAGGVYYAQFGEIEVYEASFVHGPVTLQWTAPGDDGFLGTSMSYDLRYSLDPISDLTDFGAATEVANEPAPQAAGALESFELTLGPGTYYFAIRSRDEADNVSGLSNVPTIVVP